MSRVFTTSIRIALLVMAMAIAGTMPAQVNVKFQVDMQQQTVPPEGVFIAGSFQGWDPDSTAMTLQGNAIYEFTFAFDPGESIEYKFINGSAWESPPAACTQNGNRYLTIPASDTTLPVVCFNSCDPCGTAVYADVVITVIDPNAHYTLIQFKGSVPQSGWSLLPMFDDGTNGDTTAGDFHWTLKLDQVVGPATYEWGCTDENGDWLVVGPNRTFTIDDQGAVTGDVSYVLPELISQDVMVTFVANTADSVNAGVTFNTLGIYGSVAPLDWSWGTINNPMTKNNDTIWVADVTFPAMSPKYVDFKLGRDGHDWEAPAYTNHTFGINDAATTQAIYFRYATMGWVYTGINEPGIVEMLKVYPNPSGGMFNLQINVEKPGALSLQVYNLVGQVVESQAITILNSGNQTIRFGNDLQPGMYFYSLRSGEKTITGKIVRE